MTTHFNLGVPGMHSGSGAPPAPYNLGNFQLPPSSFHFPQISFPPMPPISLPPMGGHTFSLLHPQGETPSQFFGLRPIEMPILQPPPPVSFQPPSGQDRAASTTQLGADLLADLSGGVPALVAASSALGLAKTLHESAGRIRTAIAAGNNPTEAVVCETLGAAVETAAGTAGTVLIVGQVPPYLAEVAAFPPLAATIPVVAATLPDAYANMSQGAAFLGRSAEASCHELFAAAKSLTQQPPGGTP